QHRISNRGGCAEAIRRYRPLVRPNRIGSSTTKGLCTRRPRRGRQQDWYGLPRCVHHLRTNQRTSLVKLGQAPSATAQPCIGDGRKLRSERGSAQNQTLRESAGKVAKRNKTSHAHRSWVATWSSRCNNSQLDGGEAYF